MKEILKVNNLIKKFPKAGGEIDDEDAISVLRGINFDVEQGDYVGIMGKSMVRNLMKTGYELKIGFVFQDFNLLDSLSVKENIMLPVLLDKIEQKECEEKAESLEKQFGIDQLEDKSPYELSGGERQRVAICRALINNPSIIFADEPTGNLDSKSGKVVADEFQKINETLGKTILMVTHDPQMASRCKRVIFLKDGLVMNDVRKSGSDEEFYKVIIGEIEKF